jgi:DNA-binding transcriptional regulator YdaS (Cro superfamily)
MNKVINRAVAVADGSQAELARRLTAITGRLIKQQHIWNWLNRGDRVPGEMAIPIEKATNGAVTRSDVRPDLYPIESVA